MTGREEPLPVRLAAYVVVLLVVVATLLPLYWMFVAATLPQEAFFTHPPRPYPGTAFFENLAALQERFPFLRSVWNSVFVATVYTLASLLLCSLAGFAFAKYEFPYRDVLFYLVLATLVVPAQILIVPLYLLMVRIGLVDTHLALILPFLANPVGIFLMRQSMSTIPDSWLDAARLHGMSEPQILYRIVLPSMKPMLAALGVILFLFQWNAFLYPLVVLESEVLFTIPLAIERLTGYHRVYFDQLMTATTISILPMLVLFVWLQDHFVRGFESAV